MRRPPTTRRLIAAALAALALAGCGRKGPLEPPPTAAAAPVAAPIQSGGATVQPTGATQAAAALQESQVRTLGNADNPGLIQSPNIVYEQSAVAKLNSATKNPARPINAPPVPQPSTFILDPLIK